MRFSSKFIVRFGLVMVGMMLATSANAERLAAKGQLTFLRVHDVGTGFGPPTDFIDAEVIIQLSTLPDRSLGFQLREDNEGPAHGGMLDILRDAFTNGWLVTVEYDIEPGNKNGLLVRATITKP